MQAKGNMGKSIEAVARACWLNQRGIQWQGFDLDGDNRTLSRLFPGTDQARSAQWPGRRPRRIHYDSAEGDRRPGDAVDPRAHLDGQLMKALRTTHFFDIANAQNIGITIMVFPLR